jgi:hypothetical protein
MRNLIIAILLVTNSAYGQEFNLDIHQTSLKEYLKMEEKLGSEKIAEKTNYTSLNGEAQPITFLRKEKLIPNLIVYYFFKKSDSTMSYLLYEWGVNNFEKKDNNQKSEQFQKAMVEKYKTLKAYISKEFKQPKVKRNYSNISKLDSVNTFVESALWNPNDSTEIEMYTTVSNYYEQKGVITINPVHRIRLYIRNKSEIRANKLPNVKLQKKN